MKSQIDAVVETVYQSGYAIKEGVYNNTDVKLFLECFNRVSNEVKEAGIGKNENQVTNKSIRSDKIKWIEKGEHPSLNQLFFAPLEELIMQLNRRCFLGLNDYEFHFARYEAGAFYKRHKDAFSNDDARKISVILYLNQNWKLGDGGELNIYLDNETICVQPKAGTLVVFESHLEHEVLPSNTNRISITGWLKNSKKIV